MKRSSQRQTQRGILLLLSMGVLLLISLISFIFLAVAQTERNASVNFNDLLQARLAAASGVEKAISLLPHLFRDGKITGDSWIFYGEDLNHNGLLDAGEDLNGNGFLDREMFPLTEFTDQVRPSFPMPEPFVWNGKKELISGMLETSPLKATTFRLKVLETNNRIDINGGNPIDPRDPANQRLRQMLNTLGEVIVKKTGMGDLLIDQRPRGGYYSWDVVKKALNPQELKDPQNSNDKDFYQLFPYLTLAAGRQWAVVAQGLRDRYRNPLEEGDFIYAWKELEPKEYEREWRAPINLHTASEPVLTAVFAGLSGYRIVPVSQGEQPPPPKPLPPPTYKEEKVKGSGPVTMIVCEDTPSAQSSQPSPAQTAQFPNSIQQANQLEQQQSQPPLPGPCQHPKQVTVQGSGEATYKIEIPNPASFNLAQGPPYPLGKLVRIPPISLDQAKEIAHALVRKRQERPFRGWTGPDGFFAFCDGLADQGIVSKPQAEVLIANADPNTHANLFNPDQLFFRPVDKLALDPQTTEFTFYPFGVFQVDSLGEVHGRDSPLAQAELDTYVQVWTPLVWTTQSDFTGGSFSRFDQVVSRTESGVPTRGSWSLDTYPKPATPWTAPTELDGQIGLSTLVTPVKDFTDPVVLGHVSFTYGLDGDFGALGSALADRSGFYPRLYPDGAFSELDKTLRYSTDDLVKKYLRDLFKQKLSAKDIGILEKNGSLPSDLNPSSGTMMGRSIPETLSFSSSEEKNKRQEAKKEKEKDLDTALKNHPCMKMADLWRWILPYQTAPLLDQTGTVWSENSLKQLLKKDPSLLRCEEGGVQCIGPGVPSLQWTFRMQQTRKTDQDGEKEIFKKYLLTLFTEGVTLAQNVCSWPKPWRIDRGRRVFQALSKCLPEEQMLRLYRSIPCLIEKPSKPVLGGQAIRKEKKGEAQEGVSVVFRPSFQGHSFFTEKPATTDPLRFPSLDTLKTELVKTVIDSGLNPQLEIRDFVSPDQYGIPPMPPPNPLACPAPGGTGDVRWMVPGELCRPSWEQSPSLPSRGFSGQGATYKIPAPELRTFFQKLNYDTTSGLPSFGVGSSPTTMGTALGGSSSSQSAKENSQKDILMRILDGSKLWGFPHNACFWDIYSDKGGIHFYVPEFSPTIIEESFSNPTIQQIFYNLWTHAVMCWLQPNTAFWMKWDGFLPSSPKEASKGAILFSLTKGTPQTWEGTDYQRFYFELIPSFLQKTFSGDSSVQFSSPLSPASHLRWIMDSGIAEKEEDNEKELKKLDLPMQYDYNTLIHPREWHHVAFMVRHQFDKIKNKNISQASSISGDYNLTWDGTLWIDGQKTQSFAGEGKLQRLANLYRNNPLGIRFGEIYRRGFGDLTQADDPWNQGLAGADTTYDEITTFNAKDPALFEKAVQKLVSLGRYNPQRETIWRFPSSKMPPSLSQPRQDNASVADGSTTQTLGYANSIPFPQGLPILYAFTTFYEPPGHSYRVYLESPQQGISILLRDSKRHAPEWNQFTERPMYWNDSWRLRFVRQDKGPLLETFYLDDVTVYVQTPPQILFSAYKTEK